MTSPNVVLILVDDMGFSDIGCYGGEIRTPNIDRLASGGVRFSQFYNTARCSPSRASLLTGLHPHQTGIGVLTNDDRPRGYPGTINERCVTIGGSPQGSGLRHLHFRQVAPGFRDAQTQRRLADPSRLRPLLWHVDRLRLVFPAGNADAGRGERGRRGAPARLLLHGCHLRRRRLHSSAIVPRVPRGNRSSSTSHTPRRIGRCMRARRTSGNTVGCSTRAGTCCANADGAAARVGNPGRLGGAFASATRRNRPGIRPSTRSGKPRRMEVYAAQIDRMDQGVGRILGALEDEGVLGRHDGDLPLR